MLKYLYTLIFCLIATSVFAGTIVKVAWDPNTEPDLMGYRIYIDNNQVAEIACPPNDNTCCHWESDPINDGKEHTIYGMAYDIYGNESEPSNILIFDAGGADYLPPAYMKNFRIELDITI